ncbi:SET domain-containing protein-lysine N-methyltransferase [Piscinibacter sp. XHJ-5]|uniref:SET domain-containing protein n=1 Tax=Piscinibacter sp. XHJ-5 TaxID=3037797 RepID=UPI002452C330|nr:SET domain-containing protein-lysine N-methyltransferase [Piscinibacter sp. XHJ-5]
MNAVLTPLAGAVAVEVRPSTIHGEGVFALRSLPPGWRVGVYEGRRYGPEELRERPPEREMTYVFGLSDGTLIDAADGGNATRHINHSCEPNCQANEEMADDGELDIVIRTKRRIRAGEELSIDYRLDVGGDDPARYVCRCGSARCRGTMAL